LNRPDEKLYRTGEFALKSGVTVRTLRYYDSEGLLKPFCYSQSGHRFYNEMDFYRLEQIQTLKFIGLSLRDIKEIIKNGRGDIQRSLKAQKEAIREKINHLEIVVKAIDRADESINIENRLDWQRFAGIIRAIHMEKKYDWFEKFHTKEQLDSLAQRKFTEEDQIAVSKAWADLYEDVRKNMDKDHKSPEVQELAGRWLNLVNQFTGGDPGLETNLKKAYEHINEAPCELREEFQKQQDIFAFMQKAVEVYKSINK
jgi:DNA-binding transcriptional MerR regulator